jgi:glycosyltransferase involved in cell wall biosynthesis
MSPATPPRGRIRLAIVDDNPFVRGPDGVVRSPTAMFHAFVATVVRRGPFASATYLVPVRDAATVGEAEDGTDVDTATLTLVPTAPFDGIAGYVARAPRLAAHNWPILKSTIDQADLVWIKAPASNAALAALACRRAGVPRFTWVAGSVRAVVRGQRRRGLGQAAAWAAAVAYDATTRMLERTGPAVRVGSEQFTNVVSANEIDVSEAAGNVGPRRIPDGDAFRLVWAGRVAAEKGLDDLLDALARLRTSGRPVVLDIVGDGRERDALEARARRLGLNGAVRWHGHITDRAAYLAALRDSDAFVLPSRAEGMPKVVVEAMSVGLPVIATRVGALPDLLGDDRLGRLVDPGDPVGLADAIAALGSDPGRRRELREAGFAFAREHTAEAQADRLIAWMGDVFPGLGWEARSSR